MLSVLRTSRLTALPSSFRPVVTSVTVSSLGDGMRLVALPLLAAAVTDDARQVTLVSLAGQLPWLVTGMAAGTLADRVNRRRILLAVDGLRAVLVGLLAVLVSAHHLTLPVLAAAGFLLGCGQTFYNGAWVGLVPALVDRGQLPRANARLQAGALLSGSLLGTPLGAVLYGIAPALPLAVDALSFAVSSLCMFLAPTRPARAHRAAERDRPPARSGALEGLRWLWRHRLLRSLCVVSAATNSVVVGLTSVLVLYARHALGLGATGFAFLIVAFAVGGLAGVPASTRLTARLGPLTVLRAGPFAGGAIAAAVGLAASGPVAAAFIVLYGAVNLVWNVTALSTRQSEVPDELLGRVTMVYQMATVTAGALGAPVAGLLFQGAGPRAPFLAGAALLLLSGFFLRRGRTAVEPFAH
ncbi:MFS transporter [Streptomyces flaveolus]|uniref:MFS transporter n=1 Tax=Streptomyces flaveolus TaxID=67297 RepID=UPI0033AEE79B